MPVTVPCNPTTLLSSHPAAVQVKFLGSLFSGYFPCFIFLPRLTCNPRYMWRVACRFLTGFNDIQDKQAAYNLQPTTSTATNIHTQSRCCGATITATTTTGINFGGARTQNVNVAKRRQAKANPKTKPRLKRPEPGAGQKWGYHGKTKKKKKWGIRRDEGGRVEAGRDLVHLRLKAARNRPNRAGAQNLCTNTRHARRRPFATPLWYPVCHPYPSPPSIAPCPMAVWPPWPSPYCHMLELNGFFCRQNGSFSLPYFGERRRAANYGRTSTIGLARLLKFLSCRPSSISQELQSNV